MIRRHNVPHLGLHLGRRLDLNPGRVPAAVFSVSPAVFSVPAADGDTR